MYVTYLMSFFKSVLMIDVATCITANAAYLQPAPEKYQQNEKLYRKKRGRSLTLAPPNGQIQEFVGPFPPMPSITGKVPEHLRTAAMVEHSRYSSTGGTVD